MTNQVTPASEWRKTINIETEEYGTLSLRRSISWGTTKLLAKSKTLDPREYTALVVSTLLNDPTLSSEEVARWDDSLLEKVVMAWMNETTGGNWDLPKNTDIFVAFQQYHEAEFQATLQQINVSFTKALEPTLDAINRVNRQYTDLVQQLARNFQDHINEVTTTTLTPLRTNFNSFFESIRIRFDVGKFIPNLPDISEIVERLQTLSETADAIDQGGYQFMLRYWSPSAMADFVGVHQVDPKVRNAIITNKLLTITRQDEFIDMMRELFQESTIAQRRWHIVEPAMRAHQNRNYALSIPALLAQVEGMFTDALVTRGIVIMYQGKICARDGAGNIKLNKQGDPIPLNGLGQKVQNSDLQDEYILQGLAEFFMSSLVAERNAIMHGRDVRYDRAKVSVQLVLNIFLLAAEFADFEKEK